MPEPSLAIQVADVRRFNRFYTQRIGVLEEGYQNSPFSLAEARVLYELFRHDKTTASDIAKELGLDAGYLSRVLRNFESRGLIARKTSQADGRQSHLSLTARGRERFGPLEKNTVSQVSAMLRGLSDDSRRRMIGAMHAIENTLGGVSATEPPFILRQPKPGDFGWVVARHAVLYAQEYGWTEPFEGLCAQIVADFANKQDAKYERCWIAERNGENAGSVFMVKDKPGVARLRLLLVEPSARGLGIGERLVAESIRFAREAGYKKVTLWTHSVLGAARHLYEQAGFTLTSSEKRKSWGKNVVAEYWDLKL